ncbi:MAG: ATP:cob(I)alamin adenosyltransferase, partial [Flavobacteriales bacterium]|nr:ATP:cob(I)alamin adenosyltransferase [Flavobacteriales bacterium]
MKIYTKTGDKGTTSLVGGSRIGKDDIRLESYGTIDELNSFMGLLYDSIDDVVLREEIDRIQCTLFNAGSQLASLPEDI